MPTLFEDYRNHKESRINPALLWDCDLSHFDWQGSRRLVVARVIERGEVSDYSAMLNLYGGFEGVREIIKEIPSLSPRDINFVSLVFDIDKNDLLCYKHQLSRPPRLIC